jgi:hypothetical protein
MLTDDEHGDAFLQDTAIAHTAKVLKKRCSPCPNPQTFIFEKPKKQTLKITFTQVKN